MESGEQGALRAYDDGGWLEQKRYCPSCGRWVGEGEIDSHASVQLPPRLWVYTNYDCNLTCRYCLASSSPLAERRSLSLERFTALVKEAVELGVSEVFLTGGEPFLLPEIYDFIRLSAERMRTTVLSNAMILSGRRLEQLCAVNGPNVFIQVSLDDDHPGAHDAYRGEGTWERTVEAVRRLQQARLQVRIATTVTAEAEPRLEGLRRFVQEELGIAERDHVIRPLVRRGFSGEGLEVGQGNVVPELTVDVDGIYWHPVGTDADLRIAAGTTALRTVLEEVAARLRARAGSSFEPFR